MKPYYDHNGITIYCGDCLEVIPKLGVVFDAIITDPPYGTIDGRGKVVKRGNRLQAFNPGKWDETLPLVWIKYALSILSSGAWYIVFSDNLSLKRVWNEFETHGGNGKQTFYWIKNNPPPQPRNNFCSAVESAVMGTKGAVKYWYGGGWCKNYIECPLVTDQNRTSHPTQKPLLVISYLLNAVTANRHLILDPFMGSGTTLVAAQNEGRRAVGIELSEDYCKIAVDRLKQPSFFSIPLQDKPKPVQTSLIDD